MIPGGLNALGSMALGMGQPGGQVPLQGPADPKSQYLAQALAAMGGQQQGNVGGLSANLLAAALDQYGLKQRQQQLQQNATFNAAHPNATPVGVDPAMMQQVPF